MAERDRPETPAPGRHAGVSHLTDSWRHSASVAPAVWGSLLCWVAVVLQSLLPESRNSVPPTPPARWQGHPKHHVAATQRLQSAYPAAAHASQGPTLAVRVHAGRDNPAGGALRTHCADRDSGHSWKTDHACPVHESAARCRSLPTPSGRAWRARPDGSATAYC